MIGSLKGGSGKSTVSFNLAVWLAMAEVEVAVIDADPQATLTDVIAIRNEDGYEPLIKTLNRKKINKKLSSMADEILIDIGMADIESVKKTIKICDRIVIPVPPSQADIWSAQRFIKFVQAEIGDKKMPDLLCFINRADTHHSVRESDEAAAALIAMKGVKFIKPRLSQRTIFRRSFSEGLAVFELEGNSKAAKELTTLCAALYPDALI